MAFINKEHVQEQLGNIMSDIWDIVNGGYEDYEKKYNENNRLLHSSSTKACIVHDHQVARAASYAVKNSAFGSRLIDVSQLKILLVQDKFAIRFKKLNSEKKSSNQFTKQVKDFLSQESLAGIPLTHNLEAGYIASNDSNAISVYLTCPSGFKTAPTGILNSLMGKLKKQMESCLNILSILIFLMMRLRYTRKGKTILLSLRVE